MLQQREVTLPQEKSASDRHLPKVIKWKGVSMVRNHSFLSTVRQIIDFSKTLDVVKIGIIGDQHSGKSTLAQSIAHCIHNLSKEIPYAIRVFNKHHLLKFEETLKTLQPANYVLVFDDVSFLGANAGKQQLEIIKQAVTEIRHLDGGQDVKIITIMNYHYTLGLDKYLRTADFFYYTTVGSSEKDNIEKMVGSKYIPLIEEFKKMRRHGVAKGYFSIRIGPKEPFPYKFRNPFQPALFYNNDALRLIVTPTRQWVDPICSICEEALGNTTSSEIDIPTFCKQGETNFGSGNFIAAIKLDLYTNGLTVYGKHVVQALRFIARARAKKLIVLEQLAAHYGLEITKTALLKKKEAVLE